MQQLPSVKNVINLPTVVLKVNKKNYLLYKINIPFIYNYNI